MWWNRGNFFARGESTYYRCDFWISDFVSSVTPLINFQFTDYRIIWDKKKANSLRWSSYNLFFFFFLYTRNFFFKKHLERVCFVCKYTRKGQTDQLGRKLVFVGCRNGQKLCEIFNRQTLELARAIVFEKCHIDVFIVELQAGFTDFGVVLVQ